MLPIIQSLAQLEKNYGKEGSLFVSFIPYWKSVKVIIQSEMTANIRQKQLFVKVQRLSEIIAAAFYVFTDSDEYERRHKNGVQHNSALVFTLQVEKGFCPLLVKEKANVFETMYGSVSFSKSGWTQVGKIGTPSGRSLPLPGMSDVGWVLVSAGENAPLAPSSINVKSKRQNCRK